MQKIWILGYLISVCYYLVGEPREEEARLQIELHKSTKQETMRSLRLSDKFQCSVREELFTMISQIREQVLRDTVRHTSLEVFMTQSPKVWRLCI